MGDFNVHLGANRKGIEKYKGPFCDTRNKINDNGYKLIDTCIQHNLFITNTFFKHRQSQVYTWYKWNSLECKSQIDFILTKRNNRRKITDVRVIPNMCADADHKAVIITVKTNRAKNNKHKKKHEASRVTRYTEIGRTKHVRKKIYPGS